MPDRDQTLRIVHVVREPLGGIIRNILDLAGAQVRDGHDVGLICGPVATRESTRDSHPALNSNSSLSRSYFPLGVHEVEMGRRPGVSDLISARRVGRHLRNLNPDIVHGHGAKGGLYARLANAGAVVYSPHGGVMHYAGSAAKPLFWIEKGLLRRTDGVVFVAKHEQRAFRRKVGDHHNAKVVYNGLADRDFEALPSEPRTYDLAYIGHLRPLKGVDVLIDALRIMADDGLRPRVLIAGPGSPYHVRRYAEALRDNGLSHVELVPRSVDVRANLASARMAVMPSLSEALGYFALEVTAVGRPLVATRTGGIPEVFGPTAHRLVPPGDPRALASEIVRTLECFESATEEAMQRRKHVKTMFSVESMVMATSGVYKSALTKTVAR